jgi:hypothetical protein
MISPFVFNSGPHVRRLRTSSHRNIAPANCFLLLVPSLRKRLSVALLEAMAASKPIRATSIGGHLEAASPAEVARLVRPADAHNICAATALCSRSCAHCPTRDECASSV